MQALWRKLSEDCQLEAFTSVPGAEEDGHHDFPDGFCGERSPDLVMVRLVDEFWFYFIFLMLLLS